MERDPANGQHPPVPNRGREVTVPAEWSVSTRRKVKRPRWTLCYVAAGEYMVSHDKIRPAPVLVHGTYDPHGLRTGHAWVEIGDIAYDGVTGLFYERESYLEAIGAAEIARYTWRQAAEMLLTHTHWGPWHEEPVR